MNANIWFVSVDKKNTFCVSVKKLLPKDLRITAAEWEYDCIEGETERDEGEGERERKREKEKEKDAGRVREWEREVSCLGTTVKRQSVTNDYRCDP